MDISGLFDIRGKVALVTGGTAGIGRMIAEGLVRAGADVFICARKVDQVATTEAELAALGRCRGVVADIQSDEGLAAILAAITPMQRLDILVNNAGRTWEAPLGSVEKSSMMKVYDLNVASTLMLVQALLPLLRRVATVEDPARIINIASLNGMRAADRSNFPYSTSKAAMLMLNEHLARELAGENITVNAISPGFFPSRLTAHMLDDPEFRASVASPLGGRIGASEDIAGTVIYLASKASSWLTGWNIPLGGGRKVIDS
ncbi:SDR family oxidoreductase [Sphingobium sp. V4]|uniref:SDR family NAD(P)-dependent oxidoreductase n=1 Tax=Sphingobium sp. V4 TaxID=3038927 RepID=UPI002557CCA5|nr:SDR family NAD(P)-dependent oxidoreductase [Sphingobium sp. V4]WIW89462.1 SDR family oxidoreductase [Sphingobium sp. V4]